MIFDEVLKFCVREKITISQFIFLYCEYHNLDQLYQDYCSQNGYNSKILPDVLLRDLLERELLVKKGKDIFITEKFEHLFTDYKQCGDELFEVYPAFAINTSNGTSMPLKGVDKYEMSIKYHKLIGKSTKEHKEIILDLKYAIDLNLINFKIDKFILGEMWKDFRKLRNGQGYNPIKVSDDF